MQPSPRGLGVFRRAPMRRISLGQSGDAAYIEHSKAFVRLARPDTVLLDHLRSFATLQEHISSLERVCGFTGAYLRERLEYLRSVGAILTPAEIFGHNGVALDSRRHEIEWLSVPTANRLGQLYVCLSSYLENIREYAHKCRVLVSDGSLSTEAREECIRTLEPLRSSGHSGIYYVGQAERHRFLQLLAADGTIPPDTIEFALFGGSSVPGGSGANRNAILLHTIGSAVLSVDDDTTCTTRRTNTADGVRRVAFHGPADPSEFRFFSSRAEATRYGESVAVDFLGMHSDLLGGPLRNAVTSATEADLRPACDHVIQDVMAGTGRITVSTNGLSGDSGQLSPALAMLPEETRARILESPRSMETASRSREIVRQTSSITVSHAGPLMTYTVGLDNREFLPPFFPGYRNSDGLFSQTIGMCCRADYIARLPVAIAHVPPCRGQYDRDAYSWTNVSHVIGVCMAAWKDTVRASGAEAVSALGSHLIAMGRLNNDEFAQRVRELLCLRLNSLIQAHEAALAKASSAPSFWRDYLQWNLRCLYEAPFRPGYVRPIEFADKNIEEAMTTLREIVQRFGRLLYWWPAIRERTRAFAERGSRLGTELF